MKVLIVFENKNVDNLFVPILCRGLQAIGIELECSVKKFWSEDTFYDIIHFQWPEEIIGWNNQNAHKIQQLKERIAFLKNRGTKFVYTRHNSRPHYYNAITYTAYDIIESSCDTIVHMGQFSYNEFKQQYPQSHNVIIPHHIYENTYNENISKEEAREKLGLSPDKFIITAFGKFRLKEEISIVIKSFLKFKCKNKYLLAPRLLPFSPHARNKNLYKRYISKLLYHTSKFICNLYSIQADNNEKIISNQALPYYIIASDLLFIQRKRILNSGNLPLGFLFKKIVVGPDYGNIGEILKESGNPIFTPDNTGSIVQALTQGYSLAQTHKGKENYLYAKQHFSLQYISELYRQTYTDLTQRP
ncbi:glycosyltransferase family 1 protein [Butyricimonas hominis]|uniref:glycosyltransferase family 1 protein n=1 Tax=Butyricimonas TaxID=574697 RepID=UPI00351496D4